MHFFATVRTLANSYWTKNALSISLQTSEGLNTQKNEVFIHPSDQSPLILTGLAALWYHRTSRETTHSFPSWVLTPSSLPAPALCYWKWLGNFRPCHTFLCHVSQCGVKSDIIAVVLEDLFGLCSSSKGKHVNSLSMWLVEKLWRKLLLLKTLAPLLQNFPFLWQDS